jgi:hypothetical protein
VLTDKEAADIRKKLEEGWRGPVLLTWLYRLLDDREERVRLERDPRSVGRRILQWGERRAAHEPVARDCR